MAFDLSNYETVESRLAKFWEAHPEGRIRTQMLNYSGDACVFYAELYALKDDKNPVATGWAEEIKTDRGVNATSFVENCETSAIGRACANYIFATQGKRPSREEMQKVERQSGNDAQPIEHTPRGNFATAKQIGFIRRLAKSHGIDDLRLLELIHHTLNDDSKTLELLQSHEASKVIAALQ